MGELPSVISVDFRPKDCSNLTYRITAMVRELWTQRGGLSSQYHLFLTCTLSVHQGKDWKRHKCICMAYDHAKNYNLASANRIHKERMRVYVWEGGRGGDPGCRCHVRVSAPYPQIYITPTCSFELFVYILYRLSWPRVMSMGITTKPWWIVAWECPSKAYWLWGRYD